MDFISGIFSLLSGVGSVLAWAVANPGTVLLLAVIVGGAVAYFFFKPWADLVARVLGVVVSVAESLIAKFNDAWDKYPQFRVFVLSVAGIVVMIILVLIIWWAGRDYERDICESQNSVLELRRELAAEKQKRVNAEAERDRNEQAARQALEQLGELDQENLENRRHVDELRKALKGPKCTYAPDDFERMLDFLYGRKRPSADSAN